jgi:hypothetical protein
MIADARARGAHMRSQTTFENLSMGGDIQINKKPCFSSEAKDNRHLTVGQAATRRSEITDRQKALLKAELKNFKAVGRGASLHPMLRAPKKLAETTRRPRALTPDDVMDPESISGMKCQMDWDRQKWAEKRALSLLESGVAFF